MHSLSIRADAELAADRGSPAAALALLTAAAEDIERRTPLDAAVLLAEASFHAMLAHGPARALELALSAAEVTRGADSDSEIIIRARLGDALQWNGRNREAMEEWLAASETRGSTDPRVRCAQAAALLRAGRLVAAREGAYAAAARARRAGDRFSLRDALTYQTISEIHLGLLREARASAVLLEDATHAGLTTGERLEAIGMRAWVEALLGDEAACRERFDAAGRLANELGVTLSGGMAAGLLALSRGRFEEATTQLENKLNGGSAIPAAVSLRPFLDALVEACVHSNRIDRADALVREAFPAALEASQPRFAATAYRMRALVHHDPADFEAALGEHRSWGNRFEEARTRLAYGERLRRSRRRSEARNQLSLAMSAFSTVGATAWEKRARDELNAAGARLPRPASKVPLTPQEDRIAQLVAEGLTNKAIAQQLVISTKTVEGHLRNIFEKLGVRSRTQVARAVSD
ncbi:MAG: helix-turn-helix transcriptional regulator [Actinomycetota bacterium]|nr:helix-turn-helix transcriptional regulator [Actinomycetota bacterium]